MAVAGAASRACGARWWQHMLEAVEMVEVAACPVLPAAAGEVGVVGGNSSGRSFKLGKGPSLRSDGLVSPSQA